MFAEGYSRTRIVSHFMEKDQILRDQAAADENRAREIRITISEQLWSLIRQVLGLPSSKYNDVYSLTDVLVADQVYHIGEATACGHIDTGIGIFFKFVGDIFHEQEGEDVVFVL